MPAQPKCGCGSVPHPGLRIVIEDNAAVSRGRRKTPWRTVCAICINACKSLRPVPDPKPGRRGHGNYRGTALVARLKGSYIIRWRTEIFQADLGHNKPRIMIAIPSSKINVICAKVWPSVWARRRVALCSALMPRGKTRCGHSQGKSGRRADDINLPA